jgi:hypothetical protein
MQRQSTAHHVTKDIGEFRDSVLRYVQHATHLRDFWTNERSKPSLHGSSAGAQY